MLSIILEPPQFGSIKRGAGKPQRSAKSEDKPLQTAAPPILIVSLPGFGHTFRSTHESWRI
jgi:hypothetical protein